MSIRSLRSRERRATLVEPELNAEELLLLLRHAVPLPLLVLAEDGVDRIAAEPPGGGVKTGIAVSGGRANRCGVAGASAARDADGVAMEEDAKEEEVDALGAGDATDAEIGMDAGVCADTDGDGAADVDEIGPDGDEVNEGATMVGACLGTDGDDRRAWISAAGVVLAEAIVAARAGVVNTGVIMLCASGTAGRGRIDTAMAYFPSDASNENATSVPGERSSFSPALRSFALRMARRFIGTVETTPLHVRYSISPRFFAVHCVKTPWNRVGLAELLLLRGRGKPLRESFVDS